MRAVCESFQLSKDAGFKVVAHMMPDLPNTGMERDIEQFIVSASSHQSSSLTVSECGWLSCRGHILHPSLGQTPDFDSNK